MFTPLQNFMPCPKEAFNRPILHLPTHIVTQMAIKPGIYILQLKHVTMMDTASFGTRIQLKTRKPIMWLSYSNSFLYLHKSERHFAKSAFKICFYTSMYSTIWISSQSAKIRGFTSELWRRSWGKNKDLYGTLTICRKHGGTLALPTNCTYEMRGVIITVVEIRRPKPMPYCWV